MNEMTSPISVAGLRRAPERIADEVVVGKDVIELLAGAMYADPLTVYREYVQNAADAIDQAREQRLPLPEGPNITITFDHKDRIVRIRDVGVGLSGAEFTRRLTSIGASRKRGESLRGFRGVGRLSGLGYCQELVFRSRTEKSAKVKELRWDSRVLREKLRDPEYGGSLTELVKEIATVTYAQDGADYPDRFFEVEMRKVMRINNDLLMNEDEIRRYLSEVAPLPFSPDFTYGPRIRKWLSERGVGEPVTVEMNDGKGPVYHRAVNEIVVSKVGITTFNDVELLEVKNTAGDLLAVGWMLDHGYIGAIPRASRMAGIRLRVRDVQVGDERILADQFTETRFAMWAAGEFHVMHSRIVPNGRRDEFEHSAAYTELKDELQAFSKRIGQIIRSRSDSRMRKRRARLALVYAQAWLEVAKGEHHDTIRQVAAGQAEAQLKLIDKEAARVELDAELVKDADKAKSAVKKLLTGFEGDKAKGRPPIGKSKGAFAAVQAILSSTTQIKKALPMAERVLAAMESTVGK
jgi:molecular chaperone HtpG